MTENTNFITWVYKYIYNILKYIILTVNEVMGFTIVTVEKPDKEELKTKVDKAKARDIARDKGKAKSKEPSQDLSLEDRISQKYIISQVSSLYNTIYKRHLSKSCHDLYELDKTEMLNKKRIVLPGNSWFNCYGCNKKVTVLHPVYIFSCVTCGNLFQKNRYMERDLTGRIGLVIGARTKLGHQIL
ncbi:MAG: hypothetical protein WD512_14845, partial [Candidatus Paceibacterota bacterium]